MAEAKKYPRYGPILFFEIQFVHRSYGQRKTEVTAARLDTYKSPMPVLQFCLSNTFDASSLESHESAPLFTAVMRDNDYDPLLAVSPSLALCPAWW